MSQGTPLKQFALGSDAGCLAFSTDAKLVATGDDSGSVRLWNLSTNERVGGDIAAHASGVSDVILSPDRKFLITAGKDGEIKVRTSLSRRIHTQVQRTRPRNQCPGRFERWPALGDNRRGQCRQTLETGGWFQLQMGHRLPRPNLAFTPDGKHLATANGNTRRIYWQCRDRDGKCLAAR